MGTELLPDGADGGRHAVNGEHVKGGLSHEPFVMVPGSSDQAAVTQFGGPTCQSALDKIIFHDTSMGSFREKYAAYDSALRDIFSRKENFNGIAGPIVL